MRRPRLARPALLLLALGLCALLAGFVYDLPIVQDRVGWRVSALRARVKYALSPPEQSVFTPDPTVVAMVQATLAAYTPTVTPTPAPQPTAASTLKETPTLAPTALPPGVQLTGIRHEYQKWNNCGPANLAMALSFWGWQGDQRPIAAFTKPNPRDKNVMPYELADYVREQTEFQVVVRAAGDLELLKRFVAAGLPVIVEKGFEGAAFDGWMGHYEVVTGYDDARARFTVQDSYIMPDLPVPYEQLESYWRNFNYTYLVVFPPEREAEVLALLGPHADETYNLRAAAQKASDEIFTSIGRDQFFAWFNRGTSLTRLQDYAGAAAAYDEAFQVYASLDPQIRPWRMMWYQTGPYWAYYYTGRYYDVISLTTQTLDVMSEPVLEESYYWRALAREALGDLAGAIEDLRTALEYHPDWSPALARLQQMGATP
jgi:tetratricopeptide (TPR) repeat protein